MLKTRIKASHVTSLTDARYFAARGVEWLGFNLDDGTDNFIHPSNIRAIKEWVEGPKIVGEFGLQTAEEIITASKMIGLDMVQIGHFNDAAPLKAKGIAVIKEIVLEKDPSADNIYRLLEDQSAYSDLILLNCSKNEISWNQLEPEKFKPLFQQNKILLSIELKPEDLSSILESLPVYGFVVQGGEEEKLGFKSFDELDELFDALELE